MTDTDSLERLYLSQPSVFADIFNYVIYGGRDVIDKNSLREMDSRLTAIISDDARKQLLVQRNCVVGKCHIR